jgi:hypothetical protein
MLDIVRVAKDHDRTQEFMLDYQQGAKLLHVVADS